MAVIVLPEGIERTLNGWYSPSQYRLGGTVAYIHPSKALFCVASVPFDDTEKFRRTHVNITNSELALLPTLVGDINLDQIFMDKSSGLLQDFSEILHRLEMPDVLTVTPTGATSFRFDSGRVKYNWVISTPDSVARTQIPARIRSMAYDCLL